MSYIVKQKVYGKDYYYLRRSVRKGEKVVSECIGYLGKDKKEAEKRAKEIIENMKKDKVKDYNINNNTTKIKKDIKENIKMENKEVIKDEKKFENTPVSIEDLATFCKRKGFVYSSGEIYGGIAGFWDFGPLGAELFNNLKSEWWNFFIKEREDMVGIEASIISPPKTWEASGHLASFGDLILECIKCGNKLRADHFIEDSLKIRADGMKIDEINKLIKDNNLKCPKCKSSFKELQSFNLLFKTNVGAKEDSSSVAYLRGETAQGMFMNFKNVADSSRVKLPFGIAQVGKCFRNEIAPRDFLFRSREFNIAEFEFFIHPEIKNCELLDERHLNVKFKILDSETQEAGKEDLKEVSIKDILKKGKLDEWHAYWLAEQIFFYKRIGLNLNKLKIREHIKSELSHYSSATFDIDYEFPFGSKELAGNANRGQYDLNQHIKFSKQKLEIFDEPSKKSVVPRVIEPTFGMERMFLAVISNGYYFDSSRNNIVLRLNPKIAPIKAAVFPIVKGESLEKISEGIIKDLKKEWNVVYDKGGSIGRRYSRNDEMGTPFCITVDEDSLKDRSITIRDRDTTKQIRVKINELHETLRKLINSEIEFEDAGRIVETRVKEVVG